MSGGEFLGPDEDPDEDEIDGTEGEETHTEAAATTAAAPPRRGRRPRTTPVGPAPVEPIPAAAAPGGATPETPAATAPAPETPLAPGRRPDQNPFYRNIVDTTLRRRTIPGEPNEPLEREQNYNKAEEITRLVDQIQSGEFERATRDKRYQALYGEHRDPANRRKSHLDGNGHWEVRRGPAGENLGMELLDSDYIYNEANGTVEYDFRHSLARRLENIGYKIGVKALITGGLGVVIGLLTGPAGMAAVLPMVTRALVGSGFGRIAVEIARMYDRTEREQHQALEVADIRYFQKSREVGGRAALYRDNHPHPADIVTGAPATGAPVVGASPTGEPLYHDPVRNENITQDEWDIRQSQVVKDLVNFVYSYEQTAVDVQYDSAGNAIVHPTTTPITVGTARPFGTEEHQPSRDAVDEITIGDIRTKIEERRKAWEHWSEVGELVGGLSWVGYSLLNGGWNHIVGNAFHSLQQHFASGDVVKGIDINGDLVTHAIQHTENLGNIYHLNSVGENLAAHAANSAVLPGGEFGLHNLGETAARIDAAFLKQATLQVGIQLAGVLASLGARFGIGELFNRGNEGRLKNERDTLVKNHEKWRRRLQPDSLTAQLKIHAESLHNDFPQVGEQWYHLELPGPDEEIDVEGRPPHRHYYEIEEVLENGWVKCIDLDDPDGQIVQFRLGEMIDPANGFRRIRRPRPVTPAPETPPVLTPRPDVGPVPDFISPDDGGPDDFDGEDDDDDDIAPAVGPEITETPPEIEHVPGELIITPETYTHVDDAIGRRLEPERVSHEFFRTAEVKTGEHLIVALDHKTKESVLGERLLENLADRIIADYDRDGDSSNVQDSLQEIGENALRDLVPDAEQNDFGMTLVLTLPNGRYYGLWINNTREVTNDDGNTLRQHTHQIRVSNTPNNEPRYNRTETRCTGQLQKASRLMLLGNVFDHEDRRLDEAVKRNILTATGVTLSDRIQSTYDELLRATGDVVPEEFNAIISEYKAPEDEPTPDDEPTLDAEAEKTKTKKKERKLAPEEEELKKSALSWAEVRLLAKDGINIEQKIIAIEDGQIFHTAVKGKDGKVNDIFYEISKDPKKPKSIFAKAFGLNKKDEVVMGGKTLEFDSMDEFRIWLEAEKATFAADTMKGFEKMIEDEKAKTP